jgi:WD40 repeat protein
LEQESPPPLGFVREVQLHHTKRVTALAFSPRGQVIASGSEDCSVRLGHVVRGEQLMIQPHEKADPIWRVIAVAVSPDGYTVASVSRGAQKTSEDMMQPWLWQPIPGTRTEPGRRDRFAYPFNSPSFSPTEGVIAFACDRVRLFDVDTGEPCAEFPNEANYPRCVCFAPDGQHLITGDDDGTVVIWTRSGQNLRVLEGHNEVVTALAVSPDGTLLASASDDRSVRLWDFPAGTLRQVFSDGWQTTPYLAFMPDSLRLVSFHDPETPGTVRLWHAQNGSIGQAWSPADRQLSCVALSPDGEQLATGGDNGRMTLWNRGAILNDPEVSSPAPPDASPASPDASPAPSDASPAPSDASPAPSDDDPFKEFLD